MSAPAERLVRTPNKAQEPTIVGLPQMFNRLLQEDPPSLVRILGEARLEDRAEAPMSIGVLTSLSLSARTHVRR